MHPSEHLCKNALRMVILGHKRASKARLKANAPSLRIAETLTNQNFTLIQRGRQPRIEIDVLLWRRRRDLNSRAGYPAYSLSRGAPSATWVLLHLVWICGFGGERGIRTPGASRHHWFSRPAPSTARPSLHRKEPAEMIITEIHSKVNCILGNPVTFHLSAQTRARACETAGWRPCLCMAGRVHSPGCFYRTAFCALSALGVAASHG